MILNQDFRFGRLARISIAERRLRKSSWLWEHSLSIPALAILSIKPGKRGEGFGLCLSRLGSCERPGKQFRLRKTPSIPVWRLTSPWFTWSNPSCHNANWFGVTGRVKSWGALASPSQRWSSHLCLPPDQPTTDRAMRSTKMATTRKAPPSRARMPRAKNALRTRFWKGAAELRAPNWEAIRTAT